MKLKNILGLSSVLWLSVAMAQGQDSASSDAFGKQLKELRESFEKQQREQRENFEKQQREKPQQNSEPTQPESLAPPPAGAPDELPAEEGEEGIKEGELGKDPQLDHALELLKSWKVFKTLVAKRD